MPPQLLLGDGGGGDEGSHRGGQREEQQDLDRASHVCLYLSVVGCVVATRRSQSVVC